MADMHGRLTGDPALVLTVAGSGGTNALTGVTQTYTGASPMVVVNAVLPEDASTEALHRVDDPYLLQKAYDPATKWSTQVRDAERVPEALNRAVDIATHGRPGPVFVGVDEDILTEPVDIPEPAFKWTHDATSIRRRNLAQRRSIRLNAPSGVRFTPEKATLGRLRVTKSSPSLKCLTV